MRGRVLLLMALSACSREAQQSASFDGVFEPGTYVFLQGDAEGYGPGLVGSASTTRPQFPPLSPGKDRALLLGWSEFSITEGTEIRLAQAADRVLPPVDFAASGDIIRSQVNLEPMNTRTAPLLARTDNDRCAEVETPEIAVGGCPERCPVSSSVRDGCRLDLKFADCPIPDLTLRLGAEIRLTEFKGGPCSIEAGATPAVRCPTMCQLYVSANEASPWADVDTVQLAEPDSPGADHSLTDYHQGPFPGMAISDGLVQVPTYDYAPWPLPCPTNAEQPIEINTVEPASLVVSTSTSGACSGVPRAHSDGSRMWWAFHVNNPRGPSAVVFLYHERNGANWPTQLSNFDFVLLDDNIVPLRMAAQDNLLWLVSGSGGGRNLVGSQLHKVTERVGQPLDVERMASDQLARLEVIDVAVMDGVEQPLILGRDQFNVSVESLGGWTGDRPCANAGSSRRLKTFGRQGFAFVGVEGRLHGFKADEATGGWTCLPHFLVAAWGRVVDVAPWTDGLWLVAQLDAQDTLRILRYDPAEGRPLLPAIELGKGTMLDASVDSEGRVFALLPGRGQLLRLMPRP